MYFKKKVSIIRFRRCRVDLSTFSIWPIKGKSTQKPLTAGLDRDPGKAVITILAGILAGIFHANLAGKVLQIQSKTYKFSKFSPAAGRWLQCHRLNV